MLNTAKAMRALGAAVERTGEGAWRVHGVGVGGFRQPQAVLDFGNSGTGCRLVMGAVAGCPITATFDGDAVAAQAADAAHPRSGRADGRAGRRAPAEGGRLPITLAGRARSDPDRLSHAGAVGADQVGGAAGGARGAGRDHVIEARSEPRPHRAAARPFRRRGYASSRKARTAAGSRLKGEPELAPAPVVVPADPSSAAFPLVAALIVPGSEVVLTAS